MNTSADRDSGDRPEHLDQIRDIIFGPQKREFEIRLASLEEQLKTIGASLAQRIEQAEADLGKRLQDSVKRLEESLKGLESTVSQDRADTRALSSDMEARWLATLQTNMREVAKTLGSLEGNVKEENARLQQELVSLKDQVYADLEARITELADSRVAREGLADLLSELAATIKSGKRNAELKLVTQKRTS